MSDDHLDLTTVDGRTTLWVDSTRIPECVSYYQSNPVDSLGVNPARGYHLEDLEFLRQHSSISSVAIVNPSSGDFDLSPLQALTELRSLVISGPVPLSLKQFPRLQVFRGGWHRSLELEGCDQLRVLDLSGYRPRSQDLSGFAALPVLRELSLVQAVISSIRDVGTLRTLVRLELAHMPKLESVSGVGQLPLLEELILQKCRKLQGHQDVRAAKCLRVLRFNDCGEIPSLAFLADLPDLEEFRFVDTTIADGDLQPLLRLKRVGFLPKKHYSHTPAQVNAILRAGN